MARLCGRVFRAPCALAMTASLGEWYASSMSSIHAPDDDLDERWEAVHTHPGLAQVPGFDAPELAERAHANDGKRADPAPPRRRARRSAATEETKRPSDDADSGGGVYDDDGPHTRDEQIGHEMILEEYQNSLEKPTEIEVEGSPFI